MSTSATYESFGFNPESCSILSNSQNLIEIACHEDMAEEPQWLSKIQPFLEAVLKKLQLSGWELSVLFCQDDFIQELNKNYRQLDMPTDVLSFNAGSTYQDEEGVEWFSAGDIVISLDTLAKNAVEFEVSQDQELKRLLIHGVLHLSGMDHSDNSPEQPMLQFQEIVLQDFIAESDIIITK